MIEGSAGQATVKSAMTLGTAAALHDEGNRRIADSVTGFDLTSVKEVDS